MLVKFEVEGFKNFEEKHILDLTRVKNYEFNTHLITNNTIRVGAIFGKNSSGKSNLGLALFDVINHLTDDRSKTLSSIKPFLNLNMNSKIAKFKYTFKIGETDLIYAYSKSDEYSLIKEELCINGKKVLYYDFEKMEGETFLQGTENLNTSLETNRMSFVKYVLNNSILLDSDEKEAIEGFMDYVNNMLLFYSLKGNKFYGYTLKSESISDGIVKKGKLKDFETFLNELDIPCELNAREVDGQFEIFNQFNYGEANFFTTASTGTCAIALFYYWLIHSEEVSMIFMDEFDAFYHYELSRVIVKYVVKERPKAQILFTSHNTNLMSNELLRPDCILLIQKNKINSMSSLTQKELRFAHNLQKMYRSGTFDDE